MKINTDFQLVQIGNVVLKGVNNTKYERQKKTSYTENQYSDGSTDNSFLDLRSDCTVDFSCQFDEKNYDEKDRLQMVLDQKCFTCFFVRYEKYNGNALKNNTSHGDFGEYVPTFYFGYGKTTSNFANDYSNSDYNFTEIEASILLHPRLYRADEYINFIPKNNEALIPATFWGGGATWGGGLLWGEFWGLVQRIGTLTPLELLALVKCNSCGCTELQNILVVEDIYVKPFFAPVSSYQVRDKFTNILVTTSTLNQILATTHPLWGIRSQDTVMVEITRKNSSGTILANALTQNDTLTILNVNNSSGVKLMWKGNLPSPQYLQLRFDTNTLYDVSTGLVAIDNSFYSLETLGNNNEGLYFTGGQVTNPILQPVITQTLQVQANLPTLATNTLQIKVTNYISTY